MTVLISVLPVLIGGPAGVFYSIDPEVMYVSNALSYIKTHQIQYIDHPGTPTILTLAYLLWPWRIYAKLIAKTPFILWSLKHYDLVFFYLRLWQGVVFGVAIWIFLKVVGSITHSLLTVLFVWLALLIFSPVLRLGSGITPETLSFLIISIWLWTLTKFLKRPGVDMIPVLGLISGLAVANKFTNLFLVLASAILALTLASLSWRQRLANSLITLLTAIAGFVMGTWPIRDKYRLLINWVIKVASSTGLHAGGEKAIFDLSTHWQSILAIHHQEPWMVVGITFIILISIIQRRLRVLVSVFTIGVLVFAKYPLSYYQLANYTALVFLLTVLLSRLNKIFIAALILVLLLSIRPSVSGYLASASSAITKAVVLETFIQKHPAQKATLWEWGRAKDPAVLWSISSDWHGSVFAAEKESMRLPFYELYPIPAKKVFDLCWDQLYIQRISAKAFLDKYMGQSLNYQLIKGDDDMILIESSHCKNQGR